MLRIEIPISPEGWDEAKQEFVEPKTVVLSLEHSLVSLSKWESKWCKPFIDQEKTQEEILDYIKCMTITQNVDPSVYTYITEKNVDEILQYINAPMTATTFRNIQNGNKNNEVTTSELIYYWMFSFSIPIECQKWHLNRLLTLIRVFSAKNQPEKKMSPREQMRMYADINAARRKKYNTKG